MTTDADKHIAHDMGAHFCLDASLARLWLRCALTELLQTLHESTTR